MAQLPVISIIINNYNYARFVNEAIESALGQTYDAVEIIVVDDGSTDNSREIISRYADRIVPVFKENGGQASACNSGFAHSTGDVVIFLDADDLLLPHTAQSLASAFQDNPQSAAFCYRMLVTDAEGSPTERTIPPKHISLPDGWYRDRVIRANDCGWGPPTSGQAFARWALAHILPISESSFKYSVDYFLTRTTALCGPITSIETIGAYYRQHGKNNYLVNSIQLERVRKDIRVRVGAHEHIKHVAEKLHITNYPDRAVDSQDVPFIALRIVSYKLEGDQRMIKEDRVGLLVVVGIKATIQRADLSVSAKVVHVAWFISMFAAPKPAARWLANQFFYPEARKQVNAALALVNAVRDWRFQHTSKKLN